MLPNSVIVAHRIWFKHATTNVKTGKQVEVMWNAFSAYLEPGQDSFFFPERNRGDYYEREDETMWSTDTKVLAQV